MEIIQPTIDLVRLKQVVKITDLARRLGIKLNQNNKTLCIFHNEKTPSLSFDDKRGIFKCFGCNESGDIIDLYEKVKQVSKKQAIKELAKIAGLANCKFTEQENQDNSKSGYLSKRFSCIYEALADFCGKEYKDRFGLESFHYLVGEKRGLEERTIKKFRIFAIQDYQKTDRFLKSKFSLKKLEDAGLASKNGNLIFYRHKIIIPFFKNARIVFLQGRRIDDGNPKYINIKLEVSLFNLDTLKDSEKGSKIYICEAVFDAMILEQNGYRAISILGTNNFKPEMTKLFKGFEVVLAFDNDKAGEEATQKVAKIFYESGQKIKAKKLPEGIKDITDFFNTHKSNN